MFTHSAECASKGFSNNLNRQVAQYSLAAAVAGVGMLALAAPAVGEVVVTKKTIHIPLATNGTLEPVNISMANNGVDNFKFSFYQSQSYRHLNVGGLSLRDELEVGTGPGFNVYFGALSRGAKVGPNVPSSFFNGGGIVEISVGNGPSNRIFFGSWGGSPKNRYLGVRFPINGQFHYGWIRLTVTTNPDPHTPVMSATITGWAYESVPNKAIATGTAATAGFAPENPAAEIEVPKKIHSQSGPSLGMLAAGAHALPMWRRETPSLN